MQQEYEDLRRTLAIAMMYRGSYIWPEELASKH
jgi:hypothetical protein